MLVCKSRPINLHHVHETAIEPTLNQRSKKIVYIARILERILVSPETPVALSPKGRLAEGGLT